MNVRSTTHLTLAALTLGFALGWWARGPDTPHVSASPAPLADERSEATSNTKATPGHDHRIDTPALHPARMAQNARADDDQPHLMPSSFRALLEAGAYSEAMGVYRDTERIDPAAGQRLKAIALEFLDTYQRQGNSEALIGLIDALLSVRYDDIDVLLLLARHQHRAEYLHEAAHTFQLIFTYALTQDTYELQIEHAFDTFVTSVDAQLAGQNRWRELSYFYENLDSLDLSAPRYQLRLAELYLEHGQPALGHQLLERLSAVPAVAAQAAELRKRRGDAHREPASTAEAHIDALALSAIGQHFYLPLRLNRTTDVQLLIDTGASMTTLSQEAFRRLRQQTRFTEVGPQIFNTAGGTAKGTVYRIEQLRLGTHTLTDVQVAVLDFALPPHVDGLLGMNVLSHFRFQVDQERALLHVQPR